LYAYPPRAYDPQVPEGYIHRTGGFYFRLGSITGENLLEARDSYMQGFGIQAIGNFMSSENSDDDNYMCTPCRKMMKAKN